MDYSWTQRDAEKIAAGGLDVRLEPVQNPIMTAISAASRPST